MFYYDDPADQPDGADVPIFQCHCPLCDYEFEYQDANYEIDHQPYSGACDLFRDDMYDSVLAHFLIGEHVDFDSFVCSYCLFEICPEITKEEIEAYPSLDDNLENYYLDLHQLTPERIAVGRRIQEDWVIPALEAKTLVAK